MTTPTPALRALTLADDREAWERLGFAADAAGTITVGTVALHFTAPAAAGAPDEPGGVTGWTLQGTGPGDLDGLPTAWTAQGAGSPAVHPNGAVVLDHVVAMTPDLDRTTAALAGAGLDLRRTREAGTPERPVRQCFYVVGEAVLELVGDVEPSGPARFWGLVAVVPDVDDLHERLGPDLLGAPKDAVQPGRRIATVRREAGLRVPLAFLTPRPARS